MTDLPDPEEDRDPELEPTRLDLRSADVIEPRIDALAKLFPEAVKDGRLDVNSMRAALGDVAEQGPERFGLTWPGKGDAIRMAQRRAEGTLVPMKDESVESETTKNVIIEGENLEVLKLLQRSYHGKVKLIYIDPPYNTGKDFVYPDNFREPLEEYLRYSGQVGENGGRLRANAETGGRYHSAWLSMMWPRLHLARSLLREDGVIVISIDDAEAPRLRMLLDEIFGEENFIAQFVWQKKYAVSADDPGIAGMHDYLLAYPRSDAFKRNLLPRTAAQDARYKNQMTIHAGLGLRTTTSRASRGRSVRRFGTQFDTLAPLRMYGLRNLLSGDLRVRSTRNSKPTGGWTGAERSKSSAQG